LTAVISVKYCPSQSPESIGRFLSEARALPDLIGNGAATAVAEKWENELDIQRLYETISTKKISIAQ